MAEHGGSSNWNINLVTLAMLRAKINSLVNGNNKHVVAANKTTVANVKQTVVISLGATIRAGIHAISLGRKLDKQTAAALGVGVASQKPITMITITPGIAMTNVAQHLGIMVPIRHNIAECIDG